LKRIERPPDESEFAVVVVLDHDGVVLLCPGEEGSTARERHRCTEGKLVRRRDVHHARVAWYARHVEPFPIDRHTDNAPTQAAKQSSYGGIPRLFDGHPVAGIDEDTSDEVQRLLCALRDDDVIRARPNGP
jgi:hypothetical protein